MWRGMRFGAERSIVGRYLWAALAALVLHLAPAGVRAADAQPEALYWRIVNGGKQVGYLLGTIHSEDARVLDFPESLAGELAACDVFAMEMVPDLPTLARLTEYMHYDETGTLEAKLGPDRYRRVMAALAEYQVPEDWKSRMKVWAVLMTLSVPPPDSGFFMDLSLSLRAAGDGLKVTGLETLEQQLSFLEDMPLEFQLQLLDQALADYDRVGEVHREMVDAYLTGSLSALQALAFEQFEQLDPPVRDYFVGQGIVARNRRMLKRLLPLLRESPVFIAVGALHLPGEEGLVALLRANGLQLEPMPSPFAPPGTSSPNERIGE